MDAMITDFLTEHRQALAALDATRLGEIEAGARLISAALEAGRIVYVCGNGGSAADAQHIAAELGGRFLKDRRGLACVALSTNSSTLTAIGNDYAYDDVFARQVDGLVRAGDVLWGISTSGNSGNVLKAAKRARERDARVLGFTGASGGKLAEHCDVCFKAPSNVTYGVQQLHLLAYHMTCGMVERDVAGDV